MGLGGIVGDVINAASSIYLSINSVLGKRR